MTTTSPDEANDETRDLFVEPAQGTDMVMGLGGKWPLICAGGTQSNGGRSRQHAPHGWETETFVRTPGSRGQNVWLYLQRHPPLPSRTVNQHDILPEGCVAAGNSFRHLNP